MQWNLYIVSSPTIYNAELTETYNNAHIQAAGTSESGEKWAFFFLINHLYIYSNHSPVIKTFYCLSIDRS